MTNDELNQIVYKLQRHAQKHPGSDSEQLVHKFLARYALTPTEHHGIRDEFHRREQRAASRDRSR